jgi:DNA-binding FadR family transcriptional regulator
MNRELEQLILAYEAVSASRDLEAERNMQAFESLLDAVMERHPGLAREVLRKAVIRAHRNWALKQENKPPVIPPKA